MSKPASKSTDIVTFPVRLSFPALFEPKPVAKDSPILKYQASLLLPPDYDKKSLYAALRAAAVGRWGDKIPQFSAANNPIKPCEGKVKALSGYEPGWFYINAKSGYPPLVVDQRRQEIIDPNKIYAGCWVRASINAFAYHHTQGGPGVSFGLNAIQLVREDTRFDGRRTAEDLFDTIEVEADSDSFAEDPFGGPQSAPAKRTGSADSLFG